MKLKFLVYSPARKFFTDYPDRKVHQNEQQIKWMAMKFFLEGNIEKGIFFAEKAMSCHSEIFNCTEIRVSNCQDLVQLAKINNAIPNALILLDDPVNADDRVFCAKYYKAVAKWKVIAV
jgi:hypothetical protein